VGVRGRVGHAARCRPRPLPVCGAVPNVARSFIQSPRGFESGDAGALESVRRARWPRTVDPSDREGRRPGGRIPPTPSATIRSAMLGTSRDITVVAEEARRERDRCEEEKTRARLAAVAPDFLPRFDRLLEHSRYWRQALNGDRIHLDGEAEWCESWSLRSSRRPEGRWRGAVRSGGDCEVRSGEAPLRRLSPRAGCRHAVLSSRPTGRRSGRARLPLRFDKLDTASARQEVIS